MPSPGGRPMKTSILAANLAALGLGGAAVGLAYRMDRAYRLPYLRDYLVYIVLSGISGFFDWIIFNFVNAFVPGMTAENADAIYHLFWDSIGFPCAMAAAACLLFTMMGLLNARLDARKRRILAVPFILMGGLSLARVFPAIGTAGTPVGKILWGAFLYALPVFQAAVLVFAFVRARALPDRDGSFIRLFILLNFMGVAVWHALSLVPSRLHPSYGISILWYFLALLAPAVFLRRRLGLTQRLEVPAEFSPEAMAPVFERFDLTDREKGLCLLLIKGKSYKAISAELFISLQTVKNHVSRIYGKMGVRNRLELINLVRNSLRQA